MFSQSYINSLIKFRLEDLTNSSEHLKQRRVKVSLNKEGSQVLIIYDTNHLTHSGQYFLYRNHNNVWILEYTDSVIVPEWLEHYRSDGWIFHDQPGFAIKLCNTSDERTGITYYYILDDDQYVLDSATDNSRIGFNNNAYFIEEGF